MNRWILTCSSYVILDPRVKGLPTRAILLKSATYTSVCSIVCSVYQTVLCEINKIFNTTNFKFKFKFIMREKATTSHSLPLYYPANMNKVFNTFLNIKNQLKIFRGMLATPSLFKISRSQ